MRRIVVTEFVTLDGVMEDPGGAENFSRGGGLAGDRGGHRVPAIEDDLHNGHRLARLYRFHSAGQLIPRGQSHGSSSPDVGVAQPTPTLADRARVVSDLVARRPTCRA
jgi:hypothetical protein